MRAQNMYFLLLLYLAGCIGPNPDYDPSGVGGMPDMTSMPASPMTKRLFVTSISYESYFVSDVLCQYAAENGKLGGAWIAWLSTQTIRPLNAIDRIVDLGPWYDLKGNKVFENKETMVTGPLVPIQIDELGHEVFAGSRIWTGTDSLGSYSNVCFNNKRRLVWSSQQSTDFGNIGETGRTDIRWTFVGSLPCTEKAHLMCIEQ